MLTFVEDINDLGITISNDLKVSKHIGKIIKKANQAVHFLVSRFISKDRNILLALYTTYIRPILEYNSEAWNPMLIKDINALESVQRNFTRRIDGLHDLSYSERLITLSLPTLKFRRKIRDLVCVYRILNGFTILNPYDFFTLRHDITMRPNRGNSLTLVTGKFRLTQTKNFFKNRVVPWWNALNDFIVKSSSISSFKNRCEKFYQYEKYF